MGGDILLKKKPKFDKKTMNIKVNMSSLIYYYN